MNTATTSEEVQSIDATFSRMNPNRAMLKPQKLLPGQLMTNVTEYGCWLACVYEHDAGEPATLMHPGVDPMVELHAVYTEHGDCVWNSVMDVHLLSADRVRELERVILKQHEGF